MSRATLPGPLRRLARERFRLVAIVLLALVALAAAGIQAGAAAALRASLDANWRGLYDILVLPAGAQIPGKGLPPNTLSSSATGLTFDDLATVRGIGGVEVAAPIGEIVVPGLKFDPPKVTIPRDLVEAFDAPQAYRVTVQYTTDDGLGERLVSSSELEIIVDGTGSEREARECGPFEGYSIDDYEAEQGEYPALEASLCQSDINARDGVFQPHGSNGFAFQDARDEESPLILMLSDPPAPSGMTRIALVDPIAERALLGERGAFLDELVALDAHAAPNTDAMLAWARGDGGRYGQDFLDQQALFDQFDPRRDEAVLADLRRLWAAHGDDYDEWVAERRGLAAYLPLLVTDAPVASLDVRVSVESLGSVMINSRPDGFGLEMPAFPTGPGEPAGTTVADVSSSLNPFVADATIIGWPGTEAVDLGPIDAFASQSLRAVGRTISTGYSQARGTAFVEAAGYLDPQGLSAPGPDSDPFLLDDHGEDAGQEAAYAELERLVMYPDPGIVAVPVGVFDPSAVGAVDAVNYVPLGAYEPVGSTISSGEHAGATLAPSVSGLGLISPRTIAIAPISAAGAWGQEDPINAIRVRVAGIDGYSPAAQQHVVETAAAIEALGYEVVIVAGSSPAPVSVEVDGYAFGVTGPDDTQRVGALGTVEQQWSELGAAARAEVAISTSSIVLLALALAATILLLAAAQVATIPARRDRAAVMRELGFTRPRIAGWIAGEEVLGLAVVAIAGAAALLVSGATAIAMIAAGSAVGVVGIVSVVAIAAGSRATAGSGPPRGRSNRLGARSVAGFGVRQAGIHLLVSLTHVVAIILVGLAAAAIAAAVLRGRESAGESLLAILLGDQLLLAQLSLATAAIVAGVVLALLGRRLDLARRAEQWTALRASGWTSGELARAQRVEGLVIAVPSILAAGAIAAVALPLGLPEPLLLVCVAAAASVITALIAFIPRRNGVRS